MSENTDMNRDGIEKENSEPVKKKIEYDESLFENSTVFGEAAHQDAKKKKLKSSTKGLIFSAAALLVAGAVLAVTLLLPKNDKGGDTSSAASTPLYTVTSVDPEKVDTVEVFNSEHPDGYTILRKAGEDGSEWLVKGYEKYDLSGARYLVSSLLSMTSTKRYVGAGDVLTAEDIDIAGLEYSAKNSDDENDRYGFAEPMCAMIVKGDDIDMTVIVGDTAPDKSGRYVTVSTDENVYVVQEGSMSYFGDTFLDMLNYEVNKPVSKNEGTEKYYDEESLARIDRAVLSGSCRKTPVKIQSPPDSLNALAFVVTEPVFRAGKEDTITNVINVARTGLTNNGAYVLGYTDADLKEYGLKDPYSTLEILIGTYRVKLSFGPKSEDGYYPCICDGSDIIYKISAMSNEWIAYQDSDLYFETLFLEYVTGIDSIQVDTDKHDVLFELVRNNPDDKSNYTIKCDQATKGVTIDKKQFNFYYGRILNLSEEEQIDSTTAEGEPYITYTITYTDKSRSKDVIRLYKQSTRRYRYTLNGKGNALVSASAVQDLYDCIDRLLAGEEIGRGA